MGVKTAISLKEVNLLFENYNFTYIEPTTNGIMDTTYILKNSSSAFILKKYERDVSQKICREKELLKHLATCNLNTPRFLVQNKEWYLYTKLKGEMPKSIQLFHIQTLARFLSTLHKVSKTFTKSAPFLQQYDINAMLTFIKKYHFYYYKKLSSLQKFHLKQEGFIHGDIFKDNTLFDGSSIAVFDFIDGGVGEFSFDIVVALLAFNPKNRPLHVKSFLQTYNQNSRQKIPLKEVQKQLKTAAKFYALLRINHDKKTKRAKGLCNR